MNPNKRTGLWYLYRRSIWYFSVAIDEIRKPLRLQNEVIAIWTLLSVWGILINWKFVVFLYLMVFLGGVLFGKFLIKKKAIEYDTTLGNYQNPELLDIIKRLERIEGQLNAKKE